MAMPSSGQIDFATIHSVFGRGYDLNAYRGTGFFYYNGAYAPGTNGASSYGTFSGGQINFSDFSGKSASAEWDCNCACGE